MDDIVYRHRFQLLRRLLHQLVRRYFVEFAEGQKGRDVLALCRYRAESLGPLLAGIELEYGYGWRSASGQRETVDAVIKKRTKVSSYLTLMLSRNLR